MYEPEFLLMEKSKEADTDLNSLYGCMITSFSELYANVYNFKDLYDNIIEPYHMYEVMLYNVLKNKMAEKYDVNSVFDLLIETIKNGQRLNSEVWPERFFKIFNRVIETTKDKNYLISSLDWTHVIDCLEQINTGHEEYIQYFNKD